MQLIRGLALWLTTCALAWPMATFYGEPMLAQLLPVAGLSLLIEGFNPTRIETAKRHLLLGRVTALELASQLIGIVAMVTLAWATRSVWALVAGALIGALAKLALTHGGLPGQVNRLRWERAAADDLIRFGKWIFLSTAFGFAVNQGDRAILGRYLSMEELGIYNIGYFLASFPVLLGAALGANLLIPLYRDSPPAESAANFARMRRMRVTLTGGLMTMLLAMALFGVELIGFLYDPRYAPAGAIMVLICCVQIPHLIGMTYSRAALSYGDSRRFFNLTAARAVLQIGLLIAGAETAGLVGALAGWGVALVLVHPMIIAIARRYGVWDPLHDAAFAVIGASVVALALWKGRDEIAALAGYAGG